MSLPRILMVASAGFGLDRFSKWLVVDWLDLPSLQRMSVWPPYFDLVMAWNKGINFGFLDAFDGRWLLVAFSVGVSLALLIWAHRKPGWPIALASGAIVGGALGNAVDRIVYGAVVDYINMSCCGIANPYAFNVADVLIVGGAVGLTFIVDVGPTKRGRAASDDLRGG